MNLNKTELENLVKDLVKKELNSQSSKKTFKDSIKDEIKNSDILDEEGVRKLVREMLVNMHKTLWQRQNSWKNAV